MSTKEPARRKIEAPEGFDSIEAFMEHVRDRWQQCSDADKDNRDAGEDDQKFCAGEQWDPVEKAKRIAKGLPTLTINTLPQIVGQVIGDSRINQPAIRVRPAEDADKDLASVREGLIRAIEHQSNARGVYTNAGECQVIGGIGNFRIELDYTDADAFDQDIKIAPVPNPFAVVWDDMAVERTGRDARDCFVVDEVPKTVFEKRWPDAQPTDMAGTSVVAQGWCNSTTVRVVEYWVIKETRRTIALLVDGKIKDITGKEAEFEDQIAKDGRGEPRVRKANRRSACMYLTNGIDLLEPAYELPIDRLPIIRVEGRVIQMGDKRVRFGLVRFAKDSSRLRNFWRSVATELVAKQARSQWLIREDAEEDQADFREGATHGDPVLSYTGDRKPDRIDPPSAPVAVLQEAAIAAQDLKDVTGIHDASLGVRSNETSGKAIQARQREGDVATVMYHDNLNAAIAEGGRIINQLIPICYDTPRTLRTIGEDQSVKLQRINDPNDPESVDLAKGKYDIVVETGPSYSTKRVEAAESMTAFVQAVPGAAGLVSDLIAKAQDWPDADKFAERLKRAIPPEIRGPDDEDEGGTAGGQPSAPPPAGPPGPPPPDPAQVQAAQMAQEAQMAQLAAATREAEAKAEKAHQDAERAKSQARLAEIEVARAEFEMAQTDGALQAMVREAAAAMVSGRGASPPPGFPATGEGAPAA